ncbi:MAG: bacteriohemerythrin [Melioribacteraceae bacterium]|nr:bacteriohemerythrin [Melioribacteraceae bacterium]
MPFIEFTDSEKVNVESIDQQHLTIVGLINKIHSDFSANKKQGVMSTLQNLIDELEIHFENEERYMKEFHYPGYISHKLEHDRFYNQIVNTTDMLKKEHHNISLEQLEGLRRWFFNHLDFNDKKCGEFLRSKGIN